MYKNQDELIEEIKSYLPDYLINNGIIKNKNEKFNCLNPTHSDKTPSMSLVPSADYKIAHCFGCEKTYNIFHICNILEGYPIEGDDFYRITIPYLCDMFNIDYESEELTDEEEYKLRIKKIYKVAEKIILQEANKNNKYKEFIKSRKWNIMKCKKFGIGAVPNNEYFRQKMFEAGFDKEDLKQAGLYIEGGNINKIFTENFVIFTIYNEKGQPVAFAGRNLNYEKDKSIPKYINTKGSLGSYNIFNKRNVLYNFNNAKNAREIYIVEGYADAISLMHHGYNNVVALMGTALTKEHINLLDAYNIRNIVLALDMDDAGRQALEKIIDKIKFSNMNTYILDFNGYKDIDELIRNNNIVTFLSLKKYTIFDWYLKNVSDDKEPEDIINEMLQFIINEKSPVKRANMIQKLALTTGFDEKLIKEEISFVENNKKQTLHKTISKILNRAQRFAQEDPGNIETILIQAVNDIKKIKLEYGEEDVFDKNKILSRLNNYIEYIESGNANVLEWGKFKPLMDIMNADVTNGYLALFGGNPGSGKTSLFVDLMSTLIKLNEDLSIIYFTIDDNYNRAMHRFVLSFMNDTKNIVTLNDIKYMSLINNPRKKEYVRKLFDTSISNINNLIKQDRLLVFDSEDGKTIEFMTKVIHDFRSKYPNKKLLVFIDNFHKMTEGIGKGSEGLRSLFRELSQGFKDLSNNYNLGIFMTVEYRKINSDSIPTNDDISETGKLHYDADAIFHIYNELKAKREKAKIYHYDTEPLSADQELIKLPTILIRPGKSKDADVNYDIYYDFFPAKNKFVPITRQQLIERLKEYSNGIPEYIINKRKLFLNQNKNLI